LHDLGTFIWREPFSRVLHGKRIAIERNQFPAAQRAANQFRVPAESGSAINVSSAGPNTEPLEHRPRKNGNVHRLCRFLKLTDGLALALEGVE